MQDRFDVGGKTRNSAIQLVLQQCCRTTCTFFVARFPYLNWSMLKVEKTWRPSFLSILKKHSINSWICFGASSRLLKKCNYNRSLRSRRSEVMGTRKKGHVRSKSSLACLPRARPFSRSPTTSACYAGYYNHLYLWKINSRPTSNKRPLSRFNLSRLAFVFNAYQIKKITLSYLFSASPYFCRILLITLSSGRRIWRKRWRSKEIDNYGEKNE